MHILLGELKLPLELGMYIWKLGSIPTLYTNSMILILKYNSLKVRWNHFNISTSNELQNTVNFNFRNHRISI